jgi:hypothetical protein
MRRSQIHIEDRAIVQDVLDLVSLAVADLRATSDATQAPGEVLKLTELSKIIALMEEVRSRHVPQAIEVPGLPDLSALTPSEAAYYRAVRARTPWVRPTAPEPPREAGVFDDLSAIAEGELSRWVAQARDQAYGLMKPAEIIALLDLTCRLPPAAQPAAAVPDFDDTPLVDLLVMKYVRIRRGLDRGDAERVRRDVEREDLTVAEQIWG